MTDRLSPQREAEIAAAVAELDADRTLSFGTWTASPVNEKSVLPPEQAFVVEDVLHTKHSVLRGSVGVFGDERHARFAALARTAVSDLLAELAAVRAERDKARAALRDAGDQIAELESDLAGAIVVSAALNRRLSEEQVAGSALYAALTMPTTPEQRQAALDKFTAVAQQVFGSEAAR
jgi:hypothetical protein